MNTKSAHDVISLVGAGTWTRRLADISARVNSGAQSGKLAAQRFAAERAIEKLRRGQPLAAAEAALAELASDLQSLYESLNTCGQIRLREMVETACTADATLMPVLHLLHTAQRQHMRGFEVRFTGLEQATPFGLLIN